MLLSNKIKNAFNADDVYYLRGDGSETNPYHFNVSVKGVNHSVYVTENKAVKINYRGIKNEEVII